MWMDRPCGVVSAPACDALDELSMDFWGLMRESCQRCQLGFGPCMAETLIELADQARDYAELGAGHGGVRYSA